MRYSNKSFFSLEIKFLDLLNLVLSISFFIKSFSLIIGRNCIFLDFIIFNWFPPDWTGNWSYWNCLSSLEWSYISNYFFKTVDFWSKHFRPEFKLPRLTRKFFLWSLAWTESIRLMRSDSVENACPEILLSSIALLRYGLKTCLGKTWFLESEN